MVLGTINSTNYSCSFASAPPLVSLCRHQACSWACTVAIRVPARNQAERIDTGTLSRVATSLFVLLALLRNIEVFVAGMVQINFSKGCPPMHNAVF